MDSITLGQYPPFRQFRYVPRQKARLEADSYEESLRRAPIETLGGPKQDPNTLWSPEIEAALLTESASSDDARVKEWIEQELSARRFVRDNPKAAKMVARYPRRSTMWMIVALSPALLDLLGWRSVAGTLDLFYGQPKGGTA